MPPFSLLLLSQSSHYNSNVASKVSNLERKIIYDKKSERETHEKKHIVRSRKARIVKREKTEAIACSLPNPTRHLCSSEEFPCPEEEVFPLSLGSPNTSWHFRGDWMSFLTDVQKADISSTTLLADTSIRPRRVSEFLTPPPSPEVVKDSSVPPKLHKKGFLRNVRYVHKYGCEDFMEYAVDLSRWKKSLEDSFLPGDWTLLQTEVTPAMRRTLLHWLSRYMRSAAELSLETWCLTVNYIDRFLNEQLIAKDCLQLVGLTALWIASKVSEPTAPGAEELCLLSAHTYSKINFLHMEMIMLAKLNFKLSSPTPAFLLSIVQETLVDRLNWSEELSTHLLEMVMAEHNLARMRPSVIADSIYSVVKVSDSNSVREFESSCPVCEPHNSNDFSRSFLSSCFSKICHLILKSVEE